MELESQPTSTTGAREWIHDLARAEIHPDAERLLNLGDNFDPQRLVEDSTVEFLTGLRSKFNQHSKLFNSYSEGGSRFHEVKVYSIADANADFMIFRNQVKLTVKNIAHGVIRVAFEKHLPGSVQIKGRMDRDGDDSPDWEKDKDLVADVGPFRNVNWVFQNQKVTPEEVAKFYFTEFIRLTRSRGEGRLRDQELIHQIKTLLQEKGLEF